MLRSTALPGHLLYVTGSIGGGAAALPHLDRLARENKTRSKGANPLRIPRGLEALVERHLWPRPRIAQGLWLRRHSLASAAIDLSDGLSTDLTHLCEESGVAAEIDAALLPIHHGASLHYALHGGDDYELLFTAASSTRIPRKIAGVAVTRIGRIVPARRNRPTVTLLSPQGPQPLKPQGWEHFA